MPNSDLWPYRGIEPVHGPTPLGHGYVGIVEEVGDAVRTIEPGQFVVGSFWASDNTCEICRAGYQSSCIRRELMGAIGTQAELARVPLADGTLVATLEPPSMDRRYDAAVFPGNARGHLGRRNTPQGGLIHRRSQSEAIRGYVADRM